VCLNITNL